MELNIDCHEGVPLVPRGGYRPGDDVIGYLSAHPVSVSVKGSCHEHECNNDIAVPLGAPERAGHRANVMCGDLSTRNINEDDDDTSSSGQPDLSDSSSEDEAAVQEGE